MGPNEKYWNALLLLCGKITTTVSVLPIIVGIWQRRHLNKPLRIFLWFITIHLMLNLITEFFIWSVNTYYTAFWKPILDYWKIENVLFLNIFFDLSEYILIGYYFRLLFAKISIKNWILWSTWAFCAFAIVNYLFFEGYRGFGVWSHVVNNSFIITLPLIYLWCLAQHPGVISINRNAYFWLCLGLVIPHLLSLLFSFTADQLYDTDFILYCKAHIGRNWLVIIAQLFYAYGFYQAKYIKYLPKIY